MSDIIEVEVNFPEQVTVDVIFPDPIISVVEVGVIQPLLFSITLSSLQENFVATDEQTDYVLAHAPLVGSLRVYINGILQPSDDFICVGVNFSFLSGTGIRTGTGIEIGYLY